MTAVRVEGVQKRFGAVHALRDARLLAEPGEVLGLLGENGAGKTTLLSILAGLLTPDAGEIVVAGEAARIDSPRTARALGIGMVHQHFKLVEPLTVLENLMLGWPGSALSLPEAEVQERATAMAAETGLEIHLDRPVETLGVGERQRVEILKVLLQKPSVLILDEPTAVLSPPEVEGLLSLIRSLAGRGTAVLLVAHKLDEVLSVADRVAVLRRGETVLEAPRSEVDAQILARAMVGQDVAQAVLHRSEAASEVAGAGAAGATRAAGGTGAAGATGTSLARAPGGGSETPGRGADSRTPVARLDRVGLTDERGVERLRDVSLEVFPGEIVGVAGVEGNGQRELARILSGGMPPQAGEITLPPEPAFIPQDRRREGLVQEFDLIENTALRLRRWPDFRRGWLMDWAALRRRTEEGMADFSVRADGPDTAAATLSGGNQQRVVLARELAGEPEFLVAENPTRGLDVAGEAFVHKALRRLRDRPDNPGGVVLLSTDLDEILALADRFFVMVRGRLEAVEAGPDLRERLGRRMLGAG